ncbi:MAG: DedA family protein [Burkholderiales bacterium]
MAFEFAPLIQQYGYAATFVGSVVEGETLLILSGLAAHRGYLSFPVVVVVGAIGGMLGDIGLFLLGRHYGTGLIARFPKYAPVADRVRGMIERHPNSTILAVRFMYGLRTPGPAVIGTTRIAFAKFAALNAVGALLWSGCWAGAGYLLGRTAEHLLGDLARVERELFGGAIVLAILIAVGLRVWRARARR